MKNRRGYTLVELIVAVGLFAIIMTLASGAYLVMINANRHVQGTAAGIDNLSFALETMTRTIRTGTNYNGGANCTGCSSFSVVDPKGNTIMYTRSTDSSGKGFLTMATNASQNAVLLTDPSVDITSLLFYANGTSSSDSIQSRVTIVVSGTVSSGSGGRTVQFTVETGATMRGTDI